MKFNQENWNDCLKTLGFTEQKNSQFGGMVVYDDKNIPCWTYGTDDEKETLYIFLSGAAYWKMHIELNG